MPTNMKRKGQQNTEIAKGDRGKEGEHTDDELSKTEKGKSNLHLFNNAVSNKRVHALIRYNNLRFYMIFSINTEFSLLCFFF